MLSGYRYQIELLFLGFASVTVQVICVRQLIGLFGGSEVLYALILTAWLVETGIWSLIAHRCIDKSSHPDRLLLTGYVLMGVLFIYYSIVPAVKNMLFSIYEPVAISHAALFSAAALVVPTMYAGSAFALICGRRDASGRGYDSAKGYFLDSAGFAVGGCVITMLTASMGHDRSVLMALSMAALVVFANTRLRGSLRRVLTLVAAIIGLISLYSIAKPISGHLSGADCDAIESNPYVYNIDVSDSIISFSAMSPYGMARLENAGRSSSIFFNSRLACDYPNPEVSQSVAIPLSMSRKAENICILGSACDGKAAFALEATSGHVVQVEPDPALRCYFSYIFGGEFDGQRMPARFELSHQDPTEYLQKTKDSFDLIFVNYNDPVSVGQGLYLTREFLDLCRSRLDTGGVVAVTARCGENFIPEDRLENINNILATLSAVFSGVVVIPGEQAIFVAGTDKSLLTLEPELILTRLSGIEHKLTYWGSAYLYDKLSPFRVEKLSSRLDANGGEVLSSGRMGLQFVNTILEMDKFHGLDASILRGLRKLSKPVLSFMVLLPVIVVLAISFASSRPSRAYPIAFIGGWFGLSGQIMLMVAYQAIAGNLYSRLGILSGLFMAGSAAGAYVGMRVKSSARGTAAVVRAAIVVGLATSVLSGVLVSSLLAGRTGSDISVAVITLLMFVIGSITGLVFNLSLRIGWLHKPEPSSPGIFYASDLIGAGIGGLLVSVVVLPLIGLQMGFSLAGIAMLLALLYSAFKIRN